MPRHAALAIHELVGQFEPYIEWRVESSMDIVNAMLRSTAESKERPD